MKVLAVRQPWAWLIVTGHKDIENRTWATEYRGPLLIQASSKPADDMGAAIRYARARQVSVPVARLRYGGIVGRVVVTGCVRHSDSPWFTGPIGWQLTDPAELPFVRIAGRLGLFDAPSDLFPIDDCEGPLFKPTAVK